MTHEPVCEADAERFLPTDTTARENHVEGVTVADQPREANRAAVHQRNPPTAAVDAKHSIVCRDAEVAPGRELEATRDRMTLHCGDDRLSEQHARRADGPVAVRRDSCLGGPRAATPTR